MAASSSSSAQAEFQWFLFLDYRETRRVKQYDFTSGREIGTQQSLFDNLVSQKPGELDCELVKTNLDTGDLILVRAGLDTSAYPQTEAEALISNTVGRGDTPWLPPLPYARLTAVEVVERKTMADLVASRKPSQSSGYATTVHLYDEFDRMRLFSIATGARPILMLEEYPAWLAAGSPALRNFAGRGIHTMIHRAMFIKGICQVPTNGTLHSANTLWRDVIECQKSFEKPEGWMRLGFGEGERIVTVAKKSAQTAQAWWKNAINMVYGVTEAHAAAFCAEFPSAGAFINRMSSLSARARVNAVADVRLEDERRLGPAIATRLLERLCDDFEDPRSKKRKVAG